MRVFRSSAQPWCVCLGLLLTSCVSAQSIEVRGVNREVLKSLAPVLGHADYRAERQLLRTELTPELADMLRRLRLRWSGLDVTGSTAAGKSIGGFACYRTVAETQAWLDELQARYPDLVQLVDIGDSWRKTAGLGGADLQVLKLTAPGGEAAKPRMFVMAGVHAREFAPVEVLSRFAQRLLEGYGVQADATWMLDHQEFHFLLQSNPDGRVRAESQSGTGTGGSAQRKNMDSSYCGSGRLGVDINRNFPFEWGAHAGSSGAACDDTYRGPGAASEPETQAITGYVRSLFPDRRGPALTDPAPADTPGLFMDLHSYSRLVLWPWGFVEQQAPNGPALETLGRRFAWFNGHTPQQSIDLYATDGTSDGPPYGELGVSSFVFEMGSQFFESCATFEQSVAPGNLAALDYAARIVRAPYRWPAGPTSSQASVLPDLALPGESVQLTARLDDSAFSQLNNGTQTVHTIAAAGVYVDTPPWTNGATAQPMQAADGAFDSAAEAVQVALAAPAVPGRRTLFVQGSDSSGAEGPPAAAFITVAARAQLAFFSGLVRSRATGSGLDGAVLQAGPWSSRSDASGAYARRLPAGDWTFVVSAPGHESLSLPVAAVGGTSPQQDFALHALCPRASQDAESGAQGWTTQQLSGALAWGIQAPASGGPPSRVWTESPTGNYSNNLNTVLQSPLLDLSGDERVELQFSSRCNTEAGFDYGLVEVRADATAAWSEVFRCSGETATRTVTLDLPTLVGKAAAQVRFRFTSDGGAVADGWWVDDIVVRASGPLCRAGQQGGSDTLLKDGFE